MSWELRCFKNANRCSHLQMTRKQSNMGKEWEIEVKEQREEQENLRLSTSEKLPDRQTCRMCHTCLPEGNGRSVPVRSESPLRQTTENTRGVQSSRVWRGERVGESVPNTTKNLLGLSFNLCSACGFLCTAVKLRAQLPFPSETSQDTA